jgi:hypothetical protein
VSADVWWADDFTVRDDNRLAVATACDADQAEQIAREHNAHDELLAALRNFVAFAEYHELRKAFPRIETQLCEMRGAIARATSEGT